LVSLVATISDTESGVKAGTPAFEVEDEYRSVQPRGSLTLGQDDHYTATIDLQASRHEDDANGRLYTIIVSAFDNAGNEGVEIAIVTVPHDQGRSTAAR
jgi:hypothetical protein